MIPKKINFFWGNEKMSWMRWLTLKSFRMLNPDWEMVVYTLPQLTDKMSWRTHESQDFQYYKGEDYRRADLGITFKEWNMPDECRSLFNKKRIGASHMSNFLKWHELSTEGGIYSDMDILYLKPMDDFYEKVKNYDIVITHNGYFSIGLLGSSGNTFFRDVYNQALKSYDSGIYQSVGVMAIYSLLGCSPAEGMNKLTKRYPLSIYNFPFGLIYPYDSTNIQDSFKAGYKIPDALAFHWYAAHEVSQKFNCLINSKNYKDYDCLFTHLYDILNNTHWSKAVTD